MLQRFAKRNWYVDLKKYEKTLISLSERCLKDEEGNVLVTLCPAPLFDPMHGDPQRDLNHDIYTSLDDQAFLIPLKERIHVVLQCEYDKEVIPLFHRHYEEKMLGKKRELRFNTLKTIYLLLLGFLLLGISYITKLASSSGFVGEFLSVAASFSMWESVDAFILERRSIRNEMLELYRLAFCKITFEPKQKDSASL
jgi:hypothetical protein